MGVSLKFYFAPWRDPLGARFKFAHIRPISSPLTNVCGSLKGKSWGAHERALQGPRRVRRGHVRRAQLIIINWLQNIKQRWIKIFTTWSSLFCSSSNSYLAMQHNVNSQNFSSRLHRLTWKHKEINSAVQFPAKNATPKTLTYPSQIL